MREIRRASPRRRDTRQTPNIVWCHGFSRHAADTSNIVAAHHQYGQRETRRFCYAACLKPRRAATDRRPLII